MFSLGLGSSLDRAGLVGLAVLLQQLSVGSSNDWLDYQRDLVTNRTDKPLVSGLVKLAELRRWSYLTAVLAILVSVLLGWQAALMMPVMLAIGWAYNLGMKSNASSVLPYALGFGTLPIFAGLASTEPFVVPFWVVVVAALLGVSSHFANALPDMFDDKATGVNALPHMLGQRISAVVISITAIGASALVVIQSTGLDPLVGAIGLGLNIGLAGLSSMLALRPKPPRMVFQLLIMASLVNAVLLMLGIVGGG